MFLENIDINSVELVNYNSNFFKGCINLSTDIEGLFPYLNNYIKDAIYNKEKSVLSFYYKSKIINLYNKQIIIYNILDKEEAIEIFKYVQNLINDCYDNKNNIKANNEMKNIITGVDIYEYLPKINCGKCGVATCLAFSEKLINGEFNPNRCVHISEVGNEANKKEVEDIYLLLGYEL